MLMSLRSKSLHSSALLLQLAKYMKFPQTFFVLQTILLSNSVLVDLVKAYFIFTIPVHFV